MKDAKLTKEQFETIGSIIDRENSYVPEPKEQPKNFTEVFTTNS